MEKMDPAKEIEELHLLKQKGVLTDEEFSQAKAKLLGTLGTSTTSQAGIAGAIAGASSSLSGAISNSLEDSAASYNKLAFLLYWGVVASIPLSYSTSRVLVAVNVIVRVVIFVVAAIKIAPSSGTIYKSHFRNIVAINIGGVAGLVLLLITAGTGGIAIFITLPAMIVIAIWIVFRLIKGMLCLYDGKELPHHLIFS